MEKVVKYSANEKMWRTEVQRRVDVCWGAQLTR